MSNQNFIPVGHIIQTKSKIDTFQFLDVKNNFTTMISFKDKQLSQIAGVFGNTAIPSQPLNFDHFNELKWCLDQVEGLAKHINDEQVDERFPKPIVADI